MSIQQYSVTVQCDYCDEVIRLSGKKRDDSNVAILRNKIDNMGWKSSNVRVGGRLQTRDCCPICLTEHTIV